MPIAIGGEVYQDELHYTASVLGIQLPTNDSTRGPTPPQKPADAFKSQGGTTVLPAINVDPEPSPIPMKKQGNIDLTKRPQVPNPAGGTSTVYSMSIGTDDGEVLIPRVARDGSKILSEDEAVQQYKDTGEHLGIFDSVDNANRYGEMLHKSQEELYKPRYQTWPERMARGAVSGAISAFTLPGDVLSGKVKPGSPQEIERASELANLMVFGPAPVASRMAEGTLGSFAGVTSKTIDKGALSVAQAAEKEGLHPEEIWNKTGFFRGADGRWRYEIVDKDAKLNNKGFDRVIEEDMSGELVPMVSVKKEGTTLSKAFDHPELYKAYPHLKDVQLLPLPKNLADRGVIGQMVGDTMYLKDGLHPDYVRSVILHELSHSIQKKEGFARGGSAPEFEHPNLTKAKQIYEDAIAKGGDPKSESLVKAKQILDEEKNRAQTLYTRLMGEVEARNVQTRMDFDELMSMGSFPRLTEDTPRFLQIPAEQGKRIK